jgi:hypothetical protein
MVKILVTVAALGSMGIFAGPAMSQDKQVDAIISQAATLLAKKEAQCAHRRIMPPDSRDNCPNNQRGDAEMGYGQGGASAQASGLGIGPGNGGGQGNGIGPGSGGGQGKGRR